MPQNDNLEPTNECEEEFVPSKPILEIDNPELTFNKVLHAGGKVQELRKNQCSVCRKIFQNRGKLERHRKVHIKTLSILKENSSVDPVFETLGQTSLTWNQTEDRQTHEINDKKVMKKEPHTKLKKFAFKKDTANIAIKRIREKKFPCCWCDKRFRDNHDLKKHLQVHSVVGVYNKELGKKVFPCVECKKLLSDRGHLKQHSKIHFDKPGEISVKAKTVLQGTDSANNPSSKSHGSRKKLKRRGPVKCPECKKMFSAFRYLKQHCHIIHSKSPEEMFVKNAALTESKTENEITSESQNTSKKQSMRKPAQCFACKKVFTSSSNLKRHLNNVHLKARSEAHEQKIHLQESDRLRNKTTIKPLISWKKKHRRTPVQCHECKKIFRDNFNLKVHTRKIHLKAQADTHSEKTLLQKDGMLQKDGASNRSNIKLLKGSKITKENITMPCPVCKKVFRHKHDLIRHQNIHFKAQMKNQDKNVKIEKSDNTKETNSNFQDSGKEVQHTEHAQCEKCGKVCSNASHLKQHSVVHTETQLNMEEKTTEKESQKNDKINAVNITSKSGSKKINIPAECPICKKMLSNKWKLQRHMNTSVHEKMNAKVNVGCKVDCPMCEKSYESKNSLVRHMKNHHPESVK